MTVQQIENGEKKVDIKLMSAILYGRKCRTETVLDWTDVSQSLT